MTGLTDLIREAIEALPPRIATLLDRAEQEGWEESAYVKPAISLAIRLDRPTDRREHESLKDWKERGAALPFIVRWGFTADSQGKRAWRFDGARAANGQPLGWPDIPVYLADPAVIYPEPPTEGQQ